VPQQLIERQTGRTIYRYRPREMSGALPPVLYKYLPLAYAQAMIERGALVFSTLSWFQNFEDHERGDEFEGTHKYFPVGGLEGTRTERDGKPHPPVTFKLPNDSLQSKAKGRDHIFIYSTSLRSGLTQFSNPTTPSLCVEIYNPMMFFTRLRAVLQLTPGAKPQTLIHDTVNYYSVADPPGNVHALPDRLVMNKHERFRDQHEYRFAFGRKRDVFDFENVEYQLVRDRSRQPRQILNERDHRMLVKVGSLADCCRLL